jgi:mono/diheme cytochrome c family protein
MEAPMTYARETWTAIVAVLLFVSGAARGETPAAIARAYEAAATQQSTPFSGLSAGRGKVFFQSSHGGEWSCASCHTADPSGMGRHARTGKSIAPLAPAANAERFTNSDKAEKWFRRNCNDVLGRQCTPQEKGDVLAYLMQVGREEGNR